MVERAKNAQQALRSFYPFFEKERILP